MLCEQVMPIWEGTTNVLSLDVLRAIQKSNGGVLVSFNKEVTRRLAQIKLIPAEELHESVNRVYQALERTMQFAQQHSDKLEVAAREFAFSLSRIYMGNTLHSVHAKPSQICAVPILLSVLHPFPFYQNSSTPLAGRRS